MTRSPALRFAPELLLRAMGPGLGMKAALFDVDGVLTDGRIYIGEHGETVKAFSTLDGHGLKLLKQAGIEPLVVTGRANAHAEVRALAQYVTTAAGGHGAAREFCDLLLMAAGRYEALLQGHLQTLDGA